MTTKVPFIPLKEHNDALTKAKIALMNRSSSAFFTAIAFSLTQEFDDTIPTACTNGKYIKYNPEFFLSLTAEERVFLMIHEAMHVAYLHIDRALTLDKERYNRAADYVINQQLHERGFKMPSMGLRDDKYAGMSTEEVYHLLAEEDKQNGGSPGAAPWEDLVPSGQSSEQLQEEVQEILVRAKIQSEMAGDAAGTIPGQIQIYLDKLLSPKLSWQKLLQRFMTSFAKTDYSFRKPNRRHFPTYHLPSLFGQSLCNLAIAVDASGSVSDHDFNVFVSETAGLMKMMKPELINMIEFDTQIHSVNKIKNVQELLRCKFTGRGGTMINEVVEWANKNKPQAILFFTDGEFYEWPAEEIKVPVIWLIHNNKNFKAPYGQVVHYEINR